MVEYALCSLTVRILLELFTSASGPLSWIWGLLKQTLGSFKSVCLVIPHVDGILGSISDSDFEAVGVGIPLGPLIVAPGGPWAAPYMLSLTILQVLKF